MKPSHLVLLVLSIGACAGETGEEDALDEVLGEVTADTSEKVWFEDELPLGVTQLGDYEGWSWTTLKKVSGFKGHVSTGNNSANYIQHYFINAPAAANGATTINAGDILTTYIYIPTANSPYFIMLQWMDAQGSWDHRAYWGSRNLITLFPYGQDGTASKRQIAGIVPSTRDAWVRLEVRAEDVGLVGKTLRGMAFTHNSASGVTFYWDRSGKRSAPAAPATPTLTAPANGAVVPNSATVRLSWNAVPGATSYALRVNDNTNTSLRVGGNNCGVDPHYVCRNGYAATTFDLPVQAGHSYTWWVHAQNSSGLSVQAQRSFSVADPASCTANSVATLQSCVQSLRNGAIDRINVSGVISCNATASCPIDLSNITRAVSIVGVTAGAGIVRSGKLDYTIVNIANSRGVTLRNLTITDESNIADTQTHRNARCPTWCGDPIEITNSSNVLLENVTVKNGKEDNIDISKSQNVTIRNSRIENAFFFGIGTPHTLTQLPTDVLIEGTTFIDNRSNAMIISGERVTIRNNLFQHNHRGGGWWVCGAAGNELCPGGQLLIDGNCGNFSITGNRFIQGVLDENPALATQVGVAGIEFGLSGYFRTVDISRNLFTAQTWSAIYYNQLVSDDSGVSITKNVMYGNNTVWTSGPWGPGPISVEPGAAYIADNCFSASCQFPVP